MSTAGGGPRVPGTSGERSTERRSGVPAARERTRDGAGGQSRSSSTRSSSRRAPGQAARNPNRASNPAASDSGPISGQRSRPGDDQPLRAHWDPTAADVGRAPLPRPDRKTQSAFGRFLHTYGWRAYAIPVLLILTIALIVATVRDTDSSTPPQSAPGNGIRNTNVNSVKTAIGAPTGGVAATVLPAGQLPDGGPFTAVGAKSWRVIPGTTGTVGAATSKVYTYTVEAENGLAPQDYGSDAIFAKLVDATLANPKSWIGGGKVAFRRIVTGTPDFRVSLTSTGTTRELCGYQIKLESSCYYPPDARVTLNEARWVRGAVSYQGDDLLYRQYQINHEIGHAIGYEQHEPCEQEGALAPVMMQQSFGVANSEIMALDPDMRANRDLVCRANPWPFPTL